MNVYNKPSLTLFFIFLVDDGTGTIECVLWLNSMKLDNNRPFELGTTIRIMGKISTVRDEKQITVYDLCKHHIYIYLAYTVVLNSSF